jgi:predicted F0F1-ATPase subunit
MLAKQQKHPQGQDDLQQNADQPQEQEASSNFVELLGQMSTLAWNLVIPIVGGVLLGYHLDNRQGGELTWTLSLLVLGVIVAFSNLYNLYIEHGQVKAQEMISKEEHKETDVQEE